MVYDLDETLKAVSSRKRLHLYSRGIMETKGIMKVCCPKRVLHSYDSNGRDRVQACGLVI